MTNKAFETLTSRLVDYESIEKISDRYDAFKAQKVSIEEGEILLSQLCNEFNILCQLEKEFSHKLERNNLKNLRQLRSKRRIFAMRIIKQLGFRWWEARDEGVFNKKQKRPSSLKAHIKMLTRGAFSDELITNTLWQVRMSHRQKSEKHNSFLYLKKMLKNEENATVEVKKSLSLHDAIGKTICAFSNTSGGKIIIGLAEKEKIGSIEGEIINNFILCGLEGDIDSNRIKLTMHLGEKLSFDVNNLEFEIENIRGRKIVVITVPSIRLDTGSLSFYMDDAYLREDNHNKKLSGREVYYLSS